MITIIKYKKNLRLTQISQNVSNVYLNGPSQIANYQIDVDNFLTFNHKSCSIDNTKLPGANLIGVIVLSHSENSKFFNSVTSPILVCIIPNLTPTQFRGPSPF